jgi:hypothetical protein
MTRSRVKLLPSSLQYFRNKHPLEFIPKRKFSLFNGGLL